MYVHTLRVCGYPHACSHALRWHPHPYMACTCTGHAWAYMLTCLTYTHTACARQALPPLSLLAMQASTRPSAGPPFHSSPGRTSVHTRGGAVCHIQSRGEASLHAGGAGPGHPGTTWPCLGCRPDPVSGCLEPGWTGLALADLGADSATPPVGSPMTSWLASGRRQKPPSILGLAT